MYKMRGEFIFVTTCHMNCEIFLGVGSKIIKFILKFCLYLFKEKKERKA